MRATTAFNTLLDLEGVTVTGVVRHDDELRVAVRLRRKRLVCPVDGCGYATRPGSIPARSRRGGGRWIWGRGR